MKYYFLILFFFFSSFLFSSEERKEESDSKVILEKLLENHKNLKTKLQKAYRNIEQLSQCSASVEEYEKLLGSIKKLKAELNHVEDKWRKKHSDHSNDLENLEFWDPGDITLSQMIMEYASLDYLYVIPQEIANLKLQLFSAIPIPRDSWNEMIELILAQNGIGVRKINPFAKQLFLLKHGPLYVQSIVKDQKELERVSDKARIFYIFSPQPEKIKVIQGFFERFSDPKLVTIQVVGTKIILVSSKENIQKLLQLYDAIWEKDQGKIIQVVNLSKISPEEGERILKTFFADSFQKARPSFYQSTIDQLMTMVLPQGLVLIGEEDNVERGKKILKDVEAQLLDPKEMTTFWYICKHSDPQELAKLLQEVYDSLSFSDNKMKLEAQPSNISHKQISANPVHVPMVEPGDIQTTEPTRFGNFIVDPKTGSILMVLRREEIEKIKDLLKKLDVPKKMVEIEILLVEKKLQDRKQSGINLLKIGSVSKKRPSGISYATLSGSPRKGILDFILSGSKKKLPAFDLTFSFLLAQDDIRINANPSIIATNQTSATISIVEEISINNGAIQLESPSGTKVEKSFTRAQYGTTIVLTPTIHLPDVDNFYDKGFVTLQTNITFDTTQLSGDDRPPVTRRHVENEVRVADGETIILGGLRRKSTEQSKEKIPFLGEIPGIGKLFGTTKKNDSNTEMFIFITPRILKDPILDFRKRRLEELMQRPGDIPAFLEKIQEAKKLEKKRAFAESLELLFDQF